MAQNEPKIRPGFMIPHDHYSGIMEELSLESRGRVMDAIVEYSKHEANRQDWKPPEMDSGERVAFKSIITHVNKGIQSYEATRHAAGTYRYVQDNTGTYRYVQVKTGTEDTG